MNKIQIFNYNNNDVRTIQKDGEPWFVLKDVCQILGISNHKMTAQRLDQDEVSQTDLTDSLGRNQTTTVINESGLYNVILRSDKPEAKPFRKWVTSEVLPTIRKHGAYMTPETIEAVLLNPDTVIKLATELKAEQEKRKALQAKMEQDKPKVVFADAVSASQTSILVGDLAKLIRQNGVDIGQNRLFDWLRNNGFLIKRGEQRNMPTQRSMEMGLFEVKESTICNANGSIRVTRTPKVTGRGQQYFVNRLLSGKFGT